MTTTKTLYRTIPILRRRRSGQYLLIPGGIADTKRAKQPDGWSSVIYLLETGAQSNLISPAAAAKVTKVSHFSPVSIRGVAGKVDKVFEAGRLSLSFAGLQQPSDTLTAIDLTHISHDAGMEVSGLIGAPALFQVVMHIDYRDNLVWCEYTPKK